MRGKEYNQEFREQIVSEVLQGTKTHAQVCREHNLASSTVSTWMYRYKQGSLDRYTSKKDQQLLKKMAKLEQKITYHDSCAGLRELGVKAQPRQLLAQVEGAELQEYEGAETCCGFGGTFCVKYSDISDHMVKQSVESLAETDAELVLGGDLGCLMNIQGKLSRLQDEGKETNLKVRHVAEVLAGMIATPPIGEADG